MTFPILEFDPSLVSAIIEPEMDNQASLAELCQNAVSSTFFREVLLDLEQRGILKIVLYTEAGRLGQIRFTKWNGRASVCW
jgi:hypothetical protein